MPGLDDLVNLYQEFADRGVKLMVVTPAPLPLARDMVEVLGVPYPLYSDPTYGIWESFGVGFIGGPPMPAWIIVDGDGVVRYFWNSSETQEATPHYPEGREILDEIKKCLNL